MNNEEAISSIAYELREGRATNELVFETLDGFNPVLNSTLAQQNVEESNAFYGFMFDIVFAIKETLINLKDELLGNKLQDEENRREMLEALKRIGDGSSERRSTGPPPLPGEPVEDEGNPGPIASGIFAAIAAAIAPLIPTALKKMFAPLGATFAGIVKFGRHIGVFAKQLVKFAGPIGIAVAIITAIVGAIKGGIKGYEEDGVAGAIKGAVIGAVDLLIGSLVKGIANAIGWILDKIGMKESGGIFGDTIKDIFDGIYNWFGGLVDFFHGLFTLDAKKTIGGVKKMLSSVLDILGEVGPLLITLVKEAVPLIGKVLKGIFWDLPVFLGGLMGELAFWMREELPGLITTTTIKLTAFTQELFAEFEKQLLPWLASIGDTMVELIGFVGTKITEFIGNIGSRIADALGFEKIGETFSGIATFGKDIIDKAVGFVTSVVDAITAVFSNPGEKIASIAESISAWRDQLYKDILRSILPARTSDSSWTDPKHWVAKAIPDSVYEFAGLPTKEGSGLNSLDEKGGTAIKAGQMIKPIKTPSIKASPSNAGQTLNDTYASPSRSAIIINQMGGNVTNMSTSNVSNNTTNMDPIFTGSALGLSAQ